MTAEQESKALKAKSLAKNVQVEEFLKSGVLSYDHTGISPERPDGKTPQQVAEDVKRQQEQDTVIIEHGKQHWRQNPWTREPKTLEEKLYIAGWLADNGIKPEQYKQVYDFKETERQRKKAEQERLDEAAAKQALKHQELEAKIQVMGGFLAIPLYERDLHKTAIQKTDLAKLCEIRTKVIKGNYQKLTLLSADQRNNLLNWLNAIISEKQMAESEPKKKVDFAC